MSGGTPGFELGGPVFGVNLAKADVTKQAH